MRSPLLLVPSFLMAAALACGDSSGPNPTAASVTGVAGDGQTASLGSVVSTPLSFTALGSTGQPVQGVAVTWTVLPAGTATFNPQSSTTDASGNASTIVTVGNVAGNLTIRATVAGVAAPVEYHIEALDPCDVAVAYTVGATANGNLASNDCQFGGPYYTDFYQFTIATQQAITATMTSAAFDTWLDAYRGNRRQIGFNNDIGSGNINSRIELILAPGTYLLAPNSRLELQLGAYSLSSAAHAVSVTGCGVYWTTRNTTIPDSIGPADCIDSVGTDAYYADLVGLIAFVNDTIKLTVRSTAMDPLLQLFRADQTGFVLVASNDDSSATTTDAFVTYAVTTTAAHVIYVGSADTASAGDGAYTLTVGGSASLGPSPLLRMPAWLSRDGAPVGSIAALPKRGLLR